MDLIEPLSRMLAAVPGYVFTVVGVAALVVLLVCMASRQARRSRHGRRVAESLHRAQELYDTAVRFRTAGQIQEALASLQQALTIYELIGADGDERAMIERAIGELKGQDESPREPEG